MCQIGMLEFSFHHGMIKSDLLPDQLLGVVFTAREFSDDLFAPVAYLLVHQDNKVPGSSQAPMPTQLVQPLSLPPLKEE